MHQLLFSKNSIKYLDTISKSDKKLFGRLIAALDEIHDNPLAGKSLAGNLKGYRSYRVGDYRIIYEVDNDRLLVYIEKIAHRKESYRQ